MVNYANTVSRYAAMKFFKGLMLSASLVSILACSPNNTEITASESQATNITAASTQTPQLKSIAALYPGGQVPADQSEAAAVKRMQSANNGISTASSFGSNALTSALFGSTKDRGAESIKAQSTASTALQPQTGMAYNVISRVQNTSLYGAYFFTIYPSERSAALAGNPNWNYEGPAFSASLSPDVGLFPVHRFRNLQNGSYLYTIYEAERSEIAANYASTFTYEGVAWYARQTTSAGWKPLYRFRNVVNGTYLFSAYAAERDAILANYAAIFQLEGIAYYVQEPDAFDKYIGTWVKCAATGIAGEPYAKLSIQLAKFSTTSGNGQVKILSTYSNSLCTNLVSSTQYTYPYNATIVGSKVINGKTVDLMNTYFDGSLIKNAYYATGRDLFLGGGVADAQGYPTVLVSPSYYLQQTKIVNQLVIIVA